jgi:hypothetical protein
MTAIMLVSRPNMAGECNRALRLGGRRISLLRRGRALRPYRALWLLHRDPAHSESNINREHVAFIGVLLVIVLERLAVGTR